MLAQRDLDFHAGIGVVTEHFNHAPHRFGLAARLGNDFNRDHLPGFRLAGLAGRNHEILADAFVFGGDKAHAVFDVQAADKTRLAMLQHFDNLAFGPAAPVRAGNTRHHAVAVQHFLHLTRAKEQVRPALIAHQETETVLVAQHTAFNEIEFFSNA